MTVLYNDIISNAKNLRNFPEFNGIYINRDLTFRQRQELNHRRQNRQQITNQPIPLVRAGQSNVMSVPSTSASQIGNPTVAPTSSSNSNSFLGQN